MDKSVTGMTAENPAGESPFPAECGHRACKQVTRRHFKTTIELCRILNQYGFFFFFSALDAKGLLSECKMPSKAFFFLLRFRRERTSVKMQNAQF